MSFKIVRNDITRMNTEAIVNTANDHATVGSGCDSAVYKAAGFDELLAFRKERIGFVPEGEAFITPGFGLKARYIIHAVSPLYQGGDRGEEDKLRSCYRRSLQIAKEHCIRSIAFPLISTGGFGYPKEEGMRIAVDEIRAFLSDHEMEIILVVFGRADTSLGEKIYPGLEEYIDQKYVEDRWDEEYGEGYNRQTEDRSQVLTGFRRDADRARDYPDFRMDAAKAASSPGKKESGKGILGMSVFKKKKAEAGSSLDEYEETCAGSMPEESAYFPEEHERKLEERMRHLSDTFSQYLMYLIREKKLENAEVYKRAIVNKKVFSKIKNNADYHPQKLTALCLCVGARLNLDESKDLLARAGYALSPCDKTDIIFSYFIENEIYDMIELDIQLEEHGLPCIIS
ncbi:MAG: macro domain-containing protein [Eubacterium sp.]|nr:macro domain-containing protein [Eubacterium sp.]